MESSISAKQDNVFLELKDLSTVNYLCLEVIIDKIKKNKGKINIKELSYQVMAKFCQLYPTNLEMDSEAKLLNEVHALLQLKYGLQDNETVFNIVQLLNYSNERIIDVKLFAAIKTSLKILGTPLNLIEQMKRSYWKNYLSDVWNCDNTFFKQNTNELNINIAWCKYVLDNYDGISDFISTMLNDGYIVNNNKKTVNDKENIFEDNIIKENDFKILDKHEKRMLFQLELNKTQFSCLEAAFEYLKFTQENYNEFKIAYLRYCNMYRFEKGAKKYPLITTLLLLYTAVYRYNEENSNGFWPEFFNDLDYLYNRDVIPVMNSLKEVSRKYNIKTDNRYYLEKTNLSVIFSHIYIPDVSIRKIYSSIYMCYFKGTVNKRTYNVFEFNDRYNYRLDKPGVFFLMEDSIIDDSFDKIIDLFNDYLIDQTNILNNCALPLRFIDAFVTWINKEKVDIDSSKEEYYLESPKICFDVPNEKIVLNLPNQKSRVYSDEECGWKITIDKNDKRFLEARIIKQKEGSYLILDEEIKLNLYNEIEIEYIFNGRLEKTWNFTNSDGWLIFDVKGRLYNKFNRQKCIVGIYKSTIADNITVIEKLTLKGWNDYLFYYIDLEDYHDNMIIFIKNQKEKSFEIEDHPSMKRSSFKLAFEKLGTSMIDNGLISVYDKIGQYNLYSPNLDINDFDIVLKGLGDNCKVNANDIISISEEGINKVVIRFDEENMTKGIYYFTIRHKNRILHKEEFALVNKIDMIDEFDMDYLISSKIHRKLAIRKNNLFEIVPIHFNTLVTSNEHYYFLEINGDVVAKFGFSINGRIIPVEKVILPLKWSIIGLENNVSNRNNIIIKDISMNEFNNSDMRIIIGNYDYRYNVLTYNLIINDKSSNQSIVESKKLAYGNEFKLNLSDIKDRLIEFTNLTIKLQVLDGNDLLNENMLINIYDKIEILNCEINYIDGIAYINWEEKHFNKFRNFKMYNYLAPWVEPYCIQLDDDIKSLKLDLKDIENGRYIPIIDFNKEKSLFENLNENYTFFNKVDIKNIIKNKYGKKSSNEIRLLNKVLYLYSKNRFEEVDYLVSGNEFEVFDAKKIFPTIIQMLYFINEQNEDELTYFINHTYKIMNSFIKNANIEEVFEILSESKEEFLINDFELILNILLACTKNFSYANRIIDILSEIDTINALCMINNNSGTLPDNLKTRMKESFDYEVLGSARDYKRIMEMVANEIEIINTFWQWIMQYKNKYILNYNYSLPRAFRIFEYENEISTIKIDGNKLDDLVEDIKCKEIYYSLTLPNRWSKIGAKKEIYDSFKLLIDQCMDSSYKQLLECSFLAVLQSNQIKEYDYYDMIIKMYFSSQWQLFNRYRAYFKLIFL